MGIPFWGIECKGCGEMHPVVMFRDGDKETPFPVVHYRCPNDGRQYEYEKREQHTYDLKDSRVR
jgi:hypothetical protein